MSLIGEENRTAILSVNLVYLLTLQFVFFVVIQTRTGRTDLAWIGMALMLSLSTLFNDRGGIYDYRIDFRHFAFTAPGPVSLSGLAHSFERDEHSLPRRSAYC